MENVKNGMNDVEFEVFCANYHDSKSQREIDWTDFTMMILDCISMDEAMGFTKAELYKNGTCFNEDEELIKYADSENEIWDRLFEVTGKEDFDDLLNKFKSCRWEDNENTAIISFEGDSKEYAILRM